MYICASLYPFMFHCTTLLPYQFFKITSYKTFFSSWQDNQATCSITDTHPLFSIQHHLLTLAHHLFTYYTLPSMCMCWSMCHFAKKIMVTDIIHDNMTFDCKHKRQQTHYCKEVQIMKRNLAFLARRMIHSQSF